MAACKVTLSLVTLTLSLAVGRWPKGGCLEPMADIPRWQNEARAVRGAHGHRLCEGQTQHPHSGPGKQAPKDAPQEACGSREHTHHCCGPRAILTTLQWPLPFTYSQMGYRKGRGEALKMDT